MPLSENSPEFNKITRRFRKNSPPRKNKRSTPLLFVGIALLAAVALTVSVESRSGGWSSKTQPAATGSKPEPAKNSAAPTAVNSKHSARTNATLAPFAPTVTATKQDSLVVDVDTDGKADPGDTLKYSVGISASGEDATGVTFTDTVDAQTTLVGGSLAASPVAVNDTFPVTVVGNVAINSANLAVPFSVTSNDFLGVNPTSTVSAVQAVNTVVTNTITATSANGGNIVMTVSGADMGKFTYNPPAGFEGTDTFTYTLSDNANATSGAPNRQATVSITVSGMIWFINNNPGIVCPCDGRLTNPFNTLASFDAINDSVDAGLSHHPATNDNIFLYESTNVYTGPVTLENGQKFFGQDATQNLATLTGLTPPTGSDPTFPSTANPTANIVNITGNGITVGSGNTLRGFTGGNSTSDINGTGFGTLNISEVTLNGTGNALNLTNGTLSASFGSISSSTSATTGISLSNVGGTLTTGSTTVSGSTGIGISVNASSAALSFAATSVTTSGGTGISLTTNTGAITFGALTITPNANQRGLLATDNTQTITIPSGTISTSGAAAVEISHSSTTTPLSVALTSVSTTGGPNGIVLKSTTGSFSVNGDGTNTSVGGNSTGGTISGMTGADGTTAGIGVYADNVSNLTLRRLTVNGTNQGYGIRGYRVNNFTLEYSTVGGTNGTSAALAPPEGAGEGAVYFGNTTTTGMTGTGVITNCNITGGRSRNFSLINSSGTLNRLTVTGTTFGLVQNFVDAQRVFSVEGRPSASGTILNTTVTGSSFAGSPGDVVNFTGQEPSTTTSVSMDVIFQNNTVTNTHGFNNVGGFGLKLANFAGMTFNVSGNTFSGADGSTIVLQMATPVAGSTIATNLSGTINNNTIGVNGVANSGSKSGNGIFLSLGDNLTAPKGQATFAITNNTIQNWHGNFGISADNTGGNYNLNATITGNTVRQPSATSFSGLGLAAGAPSSAEDIDVCAGITGNDFSASSPAGVNVDVLIGVSGSASSIRLPNYVGTTLANVETFVQNNQLNAGTTVVSAYDDNGNGTTAPSFSGGATPCTTPTTGPITASSLSAESVNQQLHTALQDSETTLYASRGENPVEQHVMKLTQSEASAMVQAAISRWAEAGMSAANLSRLQSMEVEVGDLPGAQLATVKSSKITLDETAAGYGWFFDVTPADDNEFSVPVEDKERQTTQTSAADGKFDLLTVLMRQLGSQSLRGKSGFSGAPAWLMEGTLDTGTRRAPAFKVSTVGKAKSAPNGAVATQARATTETPKVDANYQQIASLTGPRNARVVRNHAMRAAAPMSVFDVNLSIGTLPAGKSVTVVFKVTINNPFLGTTPQVSNQGTVSGSNFANVLTDDPDTGAPNDATVTQIDRPDTTVTSINRSGSDPTNASSVSWTVTFANAVRNLASSNFTLAPTGLGGSPGITGVTAVGPEPATQWTVTATTGTGSGTLGLNMTNDTGALSHDVTNLPFTGQVYTIDRTPPDTTINTNPTNPTSSNSASFTFSSNEANSTFECKLDAGSFSSCTSPQNYNSLADGSHTFQVRATDQAGNTDATPASFTWTVDTTAPNTTITANPPDPSSTNVSFSFTGDDGVGGSGVASFECQLDGGGFAACTSPKNYNGLASGSHTFDVRAIDNVGNVDATPASYTWSVDATAPETTIDTNPPNPSNSSSASFTFSSNEANSTFECQLDAGGFSACTSPKNYSGLADGSHTFQVRATDPQANTDPSPASYTWTIDTVAPDTTINSNPSNPTNSNSAAFTFSGSDPGGTGVASFECKLDGGAFAACTSPQNYNSLSDGSHTFQVRAIDAAGNVDASPASFTWTVDTTAPDTTINSNPANPTNSSSASFTFSGTDSGTGVASFECKLDAGAFAACTSPQNYPALADGSHTFQVRAIDAVGNVDASPASFTWTVDTTAPSVTINQAAGQADPTGGSPINFTAVFSEPVTGFTNTDVTVGGTAGATTAVVTGGPTTYNVAVSGMTMAGTVTASIPGGMATDGAGNANTASTSTDNTVTFTVNQPPSIAVIRGGMCNLGNGSGGTSGTMNLSVSDVNGDTVTLTATSSNTTLVPNANIVFGGSPANPTVTITANGQKNQASSIITIVADDGHGGISSIQIKVIVGTNQKETINGTNGPDMIFGLNGDDTINANAGNDLICGGNGGGTINGGDDDDTIDGGGGNDILKGQDGNDILIGGNGNDTLEGGNGDDIMTGGNGADSFNGGPGTDTATDFTPSQGDTKNGSVEIASVVRVEDGRDLFAYLNSAPQWWLSPYPALWAPPRSAFSRS